MGTCFPVGLRPLVGLRGSEGDVRVAGANILDAYISEMLVTGKADGQCRKGIMNAGAFYPSLL